MVVIGETNTVMVWILDTMAPKAIVSLNNLCLEASFPTSDALVGKYTFEKYTILFDKVWCQRSYFCVYVGFTKFGLEIDVYTF